MTVGPRRRRRSDPEETLNVVLDDCTVDRLRVAAGARGIEVELLMVRLMVAASHAVDDLLPPQQ